MQNLAIPYSAPSYASVPGNDSYMMQFDTARRKDAPVSDTSYIPYEVPPPQEKPDPQAPQAEKLTPSRVGKIAFVFIDLCTTALGVLFLAFGWLVYKANGTLAEDEDSQGRRLDRIAQYTPTVFPVLFGAAMGGALKRYATFRIQTKSGINVATLEQYIGSQSIYRAVSTHFKLRSFNVLGLFILLAWCLSPLGGQAALRVISLVDEDVITTTGLYAMPTFVEYQYGFAQEAAEAKTTVKNPVVASILAASLLSKRNQDLWGNIRLPAIEALELANGSSSSSSSNSSSSIDDSSDGAWLDVPTSTNLTYPSLVGVPVNNLSANGSNQFLLPGSYVAVTCPVYGASTQTAFTNYTAENVTEPSGDYDCSWEVVLADSETYQLAVSLPCSSTDSPTAALSNDTTRPARQLVWESKRLVGNYTRAECVLTTTYVEADVNCTASTAASDGSDSSNGSSSSSTCTPSRVRRSSSSRDDSGGYNGNWTVLDTGSTNDVTAVLEMLTYLFSESSVIAAALDPVVVYLAYPYNAVGASSSGPYDTVLGATVDVATFELRLAQLLNTILLLGTDPTALTGAFNTTAAALASADNVLNVTATVTATRHVVRYNTVWLVFLNICSAVVVLTGIFSGVLNLLIIAPDVLETISVAFLPNRLDPARIVGNTTWTGNEWARAHKHVRLVLADVAPEADVGRIGLSTVGNHPLAPIKKGRWYA